VNGIECLQHLVELGFDGFRADAVKHLPIEHVTAVFQSKPVEGKFVFGETLTFDKRQSMEFLLPVLKATPIACGCSRARVLRSATGPLPPDYFGFPPTCSRWIVGISRRWAASAASSRFWLMSAVSSST